MPATSSTSANPAMNTAEQERRIEAILRGFLPDGETITRVHKIGDGHSNDTYLLEGIDCILRAAPESGGLMPDYDIERQYRILDSVGGVPTGPPVPEVFALCTDLSVLGRPFFLMRRCRGGSTDWKAPEWMQAGGDDLRRQLSQRWIGAIAQIHDLPVDCIGEPVRTVADEAQYWLGLATDSRAPSEVIDILEDIATNPPPPSGPATCVHGDPKFANFLWTDQGDLTAVLDWEFSHVGEPLVDLGYLLGLWPAYPDESGQMPYTALSGWWSRKQIIAEWESATGRTASEIGRYELLGMAQIAAIFARGIDLHQTGRNTDVRLSRWERSLENWLENIRRRTETTE